MRQKPDYYKERDCAHCGVRFYPARVGQPPMYCSKLCNGRASDLRRHGVRGPRVWPDIQTRLAAYAEPADNGCLVWTRARNAGGYGLVRYEGKGQLAHRVAWEVKHGRIPDGLLACHRCDNPPCINTEHLFLGTDADNARDRTEKGRWRVNGHQAVAA